MEIVTRTLSFLFRKVRERFALVLSFTFELILDTNFTIPYSNSNLTSHTEETNIEQNQSVSLASVKRNLQSLTNSCSC